MNKLTAEQEGNEFYVAQFKNPDLAIFSYYVESKKEAFIIDPTYDTQIYHETLKKRQATLKYVVLTHYHADFISGHTEFKVPVIMGPNAKRVVNKFQIDQRKDHDTFSIGAIGISVLHTPGHTPESTSYLLHDAQKKQICLFTGDALFLGDVGRPDLAVSENMKKQDLAEMLFESLAKIKQLDGKIRVYPGHGSGSACGKAIGDGNFCDIGTQLEKNEPFAMTDKAKFIQRITNIEKGPVYFSFDAHTNEQGPPSHQQNLKKALRKLNVEQFTKQLQKAVLFDTRQHVSQIIKGSYWVHGAGPITSWIPMKAKPEDPILLVVAEGKEQQIIERFLRIGYYNIVGYNGFDPSEFKGQKWVPKIYDGKQVLELQGRTHLDVRNPPEHEKTGVIQGAIRIPLKQLSDRLEQIKNKPKLVVNCRTGQRARFAYSILANNGIDTAILVDKIDDIETKGLKLEKP